jgi:hypothetical protein
MPDVRTIYVIGMFTVVIVCLVILAVPTLAAEPAARTAITAIGSAAMGVLSGLLGAERPSGLVDRGRKID